MNFTDSQFYKPSKGCMRMLIYPNFRALNSISYQKARCPGRRSSEIFTYILSFKHWVRMKGGFLRERVIRGGILGCSSQTQSQQHHPKETMTVWDAFGEHIWNSLREIKTNKNTKYMWQFPGSWREITSHSFLLTCHQTIVLNAIQYSLRLTPDSWVMVKISTAGKWFHGIFHSQAASSLEDSISMKSKCQRNKYRAGNETNCNVGFK